MATFPDPQHPLRLARQSLATLTVDGREMAVIDDMIFMIEKSGDFEVLAYVGGKWPNGEVFYEFGASVTDDAEAEKMKKQFKKACDSWSAVAAVKFTPRKSERGFIMIEKSTNNQASVGYSESQRVFSIFNWNNDVIIAHELGHTLGLCHEHCRSDRDTFVTINLANVIDGMERNFVKQPNSINYSDYDFESAMHYHRMAFSKDMNNPKMNTITANKGYEAKESLMGQSAKLSVNDKADMASHYGKR